MGTDESGNRWEIIQVVTRLPDRNLLRLPGLHRSHGNRLGWNVGDHAATGRAGVLDHGHRVQVDHAGTQPAVFRRTRRLVPVGALPFDRIVKCPMLYITLATLHDDAADLIETLPILALANLGEVEVLCRHLQGGAYAIKTQLPVSPGEA